MNTFDDLVKERYEKVQRTYSIPYAAGILGIPLETIDAIIDNGRMGYQSRGSFAPKVIASVDLNGFIDASTGEIRIPKKYELLPLDPMLVNWVEQITS